MQENNPNNHNHEEEKTKGLKSFIKKLLSKAKDNLQEGFPSKITRNEQKPLETQSTSKSDSSESQQKVANNFREDMEYDADTGQVAIESATNSKLDLKEYTDDGKVIPKNTFNDPKDEKKYSQGQGSYAERIKQQRERDIANEAGIWT